MAALTFSMATTDFTASTTRKYATADTSTLTLSRVMMPWDWIGIVTIRSDSLDLHQGKTRLIEFGRLAARRRKARGLGKPETSGFLGFTHICGKTRDGRFGLRRVTISKRMRSKLHEVRKELMRRRHQPVPEQGRWLASVVRGHCAYYAVPRQQQGGQGIPRPGGQALVPGAAAPQPAHPPELGTHGPSRHPVAAPGPDHAPLAERAIRRPHPKQEPSALAAHAGICAGGPPARAVPTATVRICGSPGLRCPGPPDRGDGFRIREAVPACRRVLATLWRP